MFKLFTDSGQSLYVPMNLNDNGRIEMVLRVNEYVPCLPTHSDVNVQFSSERADRNVVCSCQSTQEELFARVNLSIVIDQKIL